MSLLPPLPAASAGIAVSSLRTCFPHLAQFGQQAGGIGARRQAEFQLQAAGLRPGPGQAVHPYAQGATLLFQPCRLQPRAQVGAGFDGGVIDLKVFDADGDGPGLPRLYAGGTFEASGTQTIRSIAMWNGTAWEPVGVGLTSGFVTSMCVFDDDHDPQTPSRLFVAMSGGDVELNPGVTHYLLLSLLAALGIGLVALFFFVASPRPGVPRRVFPGAVVAVVAGSAVSGAFAFYAGHLARFALFYGSLAAVAVTLAWLWFVCFSFLVGAELNQLLENGE